MPEELEPAVREGAWPEPEANRAEQNPPTVVIATNNSLVVTRSARGQVIIVAGDCGDITIKKS